MLATLRLGRFGQRYLTGTSSLALSTVIINLVRIASTMLMTRLLSPDVYGITGLIMSALFVIGMLSDLGFQSYIVRHQNSDDAAFINAVWTIHAVRGALLTVVAIAMAWPLSYVLGKPQVAAPLAVTSFMLAIEGQGSMNQFRALRHGRVQRFALFDFLPTITQIVAALILAYFLRNIWAVVASILIGSSMKAVLSYALFPGTRRSYHFDRDVAGDLWRFSRMIAASSAVYLVITQVDKLAMARILSLGQFGTYVIASTIASAPTSFAFNYATGIVYPTAAAAWREGRSVSDAYYSCWGKFFYLYAFAGGGLIGAADLLIRFLYDPRYLQAGKYLSILAVATALAMVTRTMQELMVANGRTKAIFELHMVRLTWLVCGGLLALARYNAMILVLTVGLMEIPVYCYAAWRMQQLRLIRWRRELTLAATIAAGLCVGGAMSIAGRIFLPNL